MNARYIWSRVISASVLAELAFLSACTIPVAEPVAVKPIVQTVVVCPKPKVYSSQFYEGLAREVAQLGSSFPFVSAFMEDYVTERDGLKRCEKTPAP